MPADDPKTPENAIKAPAPAGPKRRGGNPEVLAQYHFKKGGPSANPGGRPKGIASRIRELTNDGDDILKMFAKVVSGDLHGSTRDKLEAGKVLMDRMWGKSVEFQAVMNLAADESTQQLAGEALEALARTLKGTTPAALPTPAPEARALPVSAEVVDAEIIEPKPK